MKRKLPGLVQRKPAGTTFWLAGGVHVFGNGAYDQVVPKTGDTFIGAPGAVIDGRHVNLYAFTQHARNVTISYLTIRNFGAAGDNQDEGVVNHDSATHWVITHDTISHNAGAGVMLGSQDVLSHDCLADNGQYGFNAYSPGGVRRLRLLDNEIAGNDTDRWEKRQPGCGCTGGGKFWRVAGAVVSGNYVHANIGPGLWADTNNRGFKITDNVIDGNQAEGLIYEISYNALIADNTFARNGLVAGPQNPGFPTGAIYLSESGSDTRVKTAYSSALDVTGNRFVDNWSGVVLWENADRFCGSPDNSSTGVCTLVDPQANLHTCQAGTIDAQPYRADCRWHTRQVKVTHNAFTFDRAAMPASCTAKNGCGFNGIFSNYGTAPSWSPYMGTVIEKAITLHQGNRFDHNVYRGPWRFIVLNQGDVVSRKAWRRAPYRQDVHSHF